MVDRFFFDGVNTGGYEFTIHQAVEYPPFILPDRTDAPFSILDQAVMTAEIAANLVIFKCFIYQSRVFHEQVPFSVLAAEKNGAVSQRVNTAPVSSGQVDYFLLFFR